MDPADKLTDLLAEVLDPTEAHTVVARLGPPAVVPVVTLLLELRDTSRKVAEAAITALPGLVSLFTEEELVRWMDVAIALSEQSGATGLKYCTESGDIFRSIPAAARCPALVLALDLADQDAPMALESLRQAGAVVAAAGVEALTTWSHIGADLAKWDYVLGIEYFRRSPEVLGVISLDELKTWAAVSVRLVMMNSLGKPDYMAALTYFRTSPLLLAELASPAIRRKMLAIANALADREPLRTIELLGAAPGWLRNIRTVDWQERVVQYGMLIADKDAAATLAYLRRAPEVIRLVDTDDPVGLQRSVERFEEWFKGGVAVLDYNPEAARAYFSAETRKALEAIERAASGIALREVGRVLKLFAEGLSGYPLMIQPQDDPESRVASSSRTASGDGIIRLPARLRQYLTREENLRHYKLMTAHEAGHFEYGTYDLDVSSLKDLAAQAALRYGRPPLSKLRALDDLFQCYPNPPLLRDLWMLAEDARIEASLKAEYPGLARDMEAVTREELSRRSLTHGMSATEMVVELLVQLSGGVPDEVRVPFALEEVVGRAWALLQSVAQPHASAEAVVRAVHRAYVLIEELTAASESRSSDERTNEKVSAPHPPAGQAQSENYVPVANFGFRGVMDAERVQSTGPETMEAGPRSFAGMQKDHDLVGTESQPAPARRTLVESTDLHANRQSHAAAETRIEEPQGIRRLAAGNDSHVFLYDEWDGAIQDYRSDWCRVTERPGAEGSGQFVESTRSRYGGTIGILRRYFEGIRPLALRRVRRQADGEEVDIEAAIQNLVERQAQTSPTDDVYIRRDHRERDVAAAFLVDLSGSTGRQVGPDGARIIDIEKEGLVLLAEALEAIGDKYALYGYSGQSRRDVQFLILKDFEERYGPAVWRRLDCVQPLVQNRDGAAIRHAVHRLSGQPARVKLLIVMSDGRPLDDLYTDEYALEDTKAALREAKGDGVHVFCITVDREGSNYLARMYGEVSYLIIDRVQALPERLPRIYRILTS